MSDAHANTIAWMLRWPAWCCLVLRHPGRECTCQHLNAANMLHARGLSRHRTQGHTTPQSSLSLCTLQPRPPHSQAAAATYAHRCFTSSEQRAAPQADCRHAARRCCHSVSGPPPLQGAVESTGALVASPDSGTPGAQSVAQTETPRRESGARRDSSGGYDGERAAAEAPCQADEPP